jgi:hypothetical protein
LSCQLFSDQLAVAKQPSLTLFAPACPSHDDTPLRENAVAFYSFVAHYQSLVCDFTRKAFLLKSLKIARLMYHP